jgi:hypothetical protein
MLKAGNVRCAHCKLQMRFDATLCPHCRTAATAEEMASREEEAASRSAMKTKTRNGCLLMIAAPIVFFIVLAIGLKIRDDLDPEGAAVRKIESDQQTYAFLIKKCLQGDIERCVLAQDTGMWGDQTFEACARLARQIEEEGNRNIIYGRTFACRGASPAMAEQIDSLFKDN